MSGFERVEKLLSMSDVYDLMKFVVIMDFVNLNSVLLMELCAVVSENV